jgi:endonuclease/exonuclease/phosphatase family metal-dependent hydrolase
MGTRRTASLWSDGIGVRSIPKLRIARSRSAAQLEQRAALRPTPRRAAEATLDWVAPISAPRVCSGGIPMKRWTAPLLAAATFVVTGTASSAELEVMTQNQYVGADLIGVVSEPDFNAAAIEFLQIRAASLPAERARALAELIDKRAPALAGLQEVYLFTCVEPDPQPDDFKGCEDPSFAGAFTDQLADTLAALGGKYVEAATVVNLDFPRALNLPPPLSLLPGLPIQVGDVTILIRVVDRDVIIARAGIPFQTIDFTELQFLNAAICEIESVDGCNYQVVATQDITLALPPPFGPITRTVRFERGFVGVDAMVGGKPYRFINTHLETRLESFGPGGRYFQTAQAYELHNILEALQLFAPNPKQIVVGDFNSDARDVEEVPGLVPPYQIFAANHTDVWTRRPGASTGQGAPLMGLTCCQDEDLGNLKSALYERVDLIFSLSLPKKVQNARVLGDSVSEKTRPIAMGVWPSDHASVAARLTY